MAVARQTFLQENPLMLYLGIDQHSRQITVCVRDQDGEVILRRQVSTKPEKIESFFGEITDQDRDFAAIVEVCGFNDWLIDVLRTWNCNAIVLIQPEKQSKKKTDRRDANKLSEMLWLNRERLQAGQRPQGLRRVYIPTQEELANRQITATRKRLAELRTRTLNRIHRILHRHNLMWEYPTKTFQTKRGRAWLTQVALPQVDRIEMDLLIEQWDLWERQIVQVDEQIVARAGKCAPGDVFSDTDLLTTVPGVSHYSGLALVSRIGPIERFPRPRSLANFFGLTPGCRNSGNAQHRLGSITKEGSSIVRFHLGQLVVHVLKKDRVIRQWYRKIKGRRGSKIARVAVMRRITTILWHILTHREAYSSGGPPLRLRKPDAIHADQLSAATCTANEQAAPSARAPRMAQGSSLSPSLTLHRTARHLGPRQSRGPGQ